MATQTIRGYGSIYPFTFDTFNFKKLDGTFNDTLTKTIKYDGIRKELRVVKYELSNPSAVQGEVEFTIVDGQISAKLIRSASNTNTSTDLTVYTAYIGNAGIPPKNGGGSVSAPGVEGWKEWIKSFYPNGIKWD